MPSLTLVYAATLVTIPIRQLTSPVRDQACFLALQVPGIPQALSKMHGKSTDIQSCGRPT